MNSPPLALSPPLLAHATITPALQQVARLLHLHPYAAALELPRQSAERAARRVLERYPTTTAHRNAQSALRSQGYPVVRAVLMPPGQDAVTLLLLANTPPDDREDWREAAHPLHPLTWGPYSVTTAAQMTQEADRLRKPKGAKPGEEKRITWRLSEQVRQGYRQDITRTIHGTKARAGSDPRGAPRNTRTVPGQRARLERLGNHLATYPGLSGVNTDRWMLAVHMQRLWRQQHPGAPPPTWPRFPYVTALPMQLRPLAELWPNTQENQP